MRWNPKGSPTDAPRLGLVTEAFADRPLIDVMDWLVRAAPAISDLEVGAGGYAPTGHCDTRRMLTDAAAREAWQREFSARGLRVGALKVWGNTLNPEEAIECKHDTALHDAIRIVSMI